MPKTKDAFAFRGFDGKRILQRPYFRAWREKYHVGDSSDVEILAKIMHAETHLPLIELENAVLTDLLTRLEKFQQLIQRHANAMDGRLERYRRSVQSLQNRLNRVDEMTRLYLIDAARAAGTLAVKVKERWQASERNLQAAYRKCFGERLKAAREAAGLSRKYVASKLNLTVTGYAFYERGERELTVLAITRLSQILKISIDELFGLK